MKPRVAAEATGGVAFVFIFFLIYEYSALRADFWYLLFAAATAVAFFAYSAFPVAEVTVQAETTAAQSDFGPTVGESGYPLPEFEKAKIQDSVEMVRDLHDAVKPGAADYSETSYNFAGVRGKIVKGKAPQQEQGQEQAEPESDFLPSLPPPEE